MCESLWLYWLQHARFSCPSPFPSVCSNSCPLSQWCHPTISSSVILFSSCPQRFSASGSFSVSWFFTSDGQSTGASASAPVLSMIIQGWFPLGGMDGLERIEENGYIYMYAWVPLLSTWNYQNIANWLYSNAKQKVKKHRIVDLKYISMYFINWFLTKVPK